MSLYCLLVGHFSLLLSSKQWIPLFAQKAKSGIHCFELLAICFLLLTFMLFCFFSLCGLSIGLEDYGCLSCTATTSQLNTFLKSWSFQGGWHLPTAQDLCDPELWESEAFGAIALSYIASFHLYVVRYTHIHSPAHSLWSVYCSCIWLWVEWDRLKWDINRKIVPNGILPPIHLTSFSVTWQVGRPAVFHSVLHISV